MDMNGNNSLLIVHLISDANINELMETFSTIFWLRQHRWFVRCEWSRRTSDYLIFIYTLPYNFSRRYLIGQKARIKSTCLDEWNYCSYTNIHDIFYDENVENKLPFPIRFFNIQFLALSLSISKRFWSTIPTLNHLKSIELHMAQDSIASELQTLLDRAPRLYSIHVYSVVDFLRMKLTSRTVRRLELGSFGDFPQPFLKPEECSLLTNSSFAHQCEVLFISVTNRTSILEFINGMPHLRALVCSISEDFFENRWSRTSLIIDDELLQWFQTRLSSMCIITRDPHLNYSIRFWFCR
ncbi:hypothetical protein I4U23_022152 [Adineta vaga]|nr:hypothetical protein I4U23_022152 [Adineta vaga]